MKLVDEKKALQEISNLRRARKTFEASGSAEDSIASDRQQIDELRKQLDDPAARAPSERFDELKKEMDGLRAEGDKVYSERNKLFDERTELSAQLVSSTDCACPAKLISRTNCLDKDESQLKNGETSMTSRRFRS
jgi:uncharacterized coiled-coil DUF342 family protein